MGDRNFRFPVKYSQELLQKLPGYLYIYNSMVTVCKYIPIIFFVYC